MSESNLKRILATKSCSFDRLAEICAAAETSVFDLVLSASKAKTPVIELNQEAQDFFVDNFESFVLFRRLVAADDPNIIVKNAKRDSKKTDFYLKRLEELKLIEMRKGLTQVLLRGYMHVDDNSPLGRKIHDKWIPWLFNAIKDQPQDPQKFVQGYVDQNGGGKVEPVGICIGLGPHRVAMF